MPVALQVLLTLSLSAPFSLLDAWDAVVSARLATRLKAMRDAGDPTSLAELATLYPEPPPGKNGAPLFLAAFKAMEAKEGKNEARLARLPLVGNAELPPIGEEVPAAVLNAIRAYLKDNEEAIEFLHKAAAMEGCRFDLNFAQGVGMLLPHLSKMRQAARLLALEAIERTEAGKAGAAADSIIACLRVGEALRQEPVLISTLVRIACGTIAVGQIERWASRAQTSPEAIARVEAALAAAADPRLLERAIVAERCFGLDVYQTYVLKPGAARHLWAVDEGAVLTPAGAMVLQMMPKAYFKCDMLCYLDIMNDYVAAARGPYPEAFRRGAQAGRDLEERIPRYYFVSRMILPALGRTFVSAQGHMARCESARAGLACLRFKAKRGRLPEKLDELVPEFLKAVPPDPFDGKPLRYRADAAGLTVYAVGEDGKDDGGAFDRKGAGPPDVGFRIRRPNAQF